MTERAAIVGELETRLSEVEKAIGTRIMASWARESRFSLAEARLLLVLANRSAATPARQLADLSGLPLDIVYPSLHSLNHRGETLEEHRRYSLTEAGESSVATYEAARHAGIEAHVSQLSPARRLQLESALGFPREA
jgi:hypothetical protein